MVTTNLHLFSNLNFFSYPFLSLNRERNLKLKPDPKLKLNFNLEPNLNLNHIPKPYRNPDL